MRATTRVPHFVLLHVLILGSLPTTAPSDPMAPKMLVDAPAAEEIAFLEDLARWIDAGESPRRSLRRAIRQSPSFELFRSYHGPELSNARLEELPFGDAIRRAADRHGVDALLIAAVVEAESGFDPRAVSRRGAAGLMQVMPATAGLGRKRRGVEPPENGLRNGGPPVAGLDGGPPWSALPEAGFPDAGAPVPGLCGAPARSGEPRSGVARSGVPRSGVPERLIEPSSNLNFGTRYLRRLLERFDGDLELALAAYNAGPTNVERYGGLPPFRETERYVEKVLRLYVGHHRAVWRQSEVGEFLTSRSLPETLGS